MILRDKGITIFHKYINNVTRLEEYKTLYIQNCWYFIKHGSVIEDGIAKTDSLDIRIPLEYISAEDMKNIEIGDFVIIGKYNKKITSKEEVKEITYNITTITVNDFGNNPHLHIEG